jgi:phospholipid/cholesterol/gamma-HCH transport system substrate-binding protein
MRVRDLASFVAFGLMIALGISYIGSLGVQVGTPSQRTNISMQVSDVNSLVTGSNVLLRGVPVGKVTNVASSVNGATVDFYIEDQFRVPVDSDVRLENLSALGESYIGLVPRTSDGPMLRNGQRIATESITQPPSISELATSVVRVLNQLEPGALERIVGEADSALPEVNSVLPNLSHASRLLRNTAADMDGRSRELLTNLQTLLGNAGWLGPLLADLTPMVENLNPHVRSIFSITPIYVDTGSPDTLVKFSDYLARIQGLLDNNGGDLKVLGEALRPHLQGIAGALLNFDSGQILANVLENMPDDGAITLHVSIPEN